MNRRSILQFVVALFLTRWSISGRAIANPPRDLRECFENDFFRRDQVLSGRSRWIIRHHRWAIAAVGGYLGRRAVVADLVPGTIKAVIRRATERRGIHVAQQYEAALYGMAGHVAPERDPA